MGLSAGHIKSFNEGKIRVNDAFYLSNFKGIRNIGYSLDAEQKKNKLNGDILGFDRYATLNLKIAHIDSPLLRDFAIEPFIYANFALAPRRQQKEKVWDESSWLGRYLRYSTGIGLSMQSANFAIECYYNVMVSKQKHEV